MSSKQAAATSSGRKSKPAPPPAASGEKLETMMEKLEINNNNNKPAAAPPVVSLSSSDSEMKPRKIVGAAAAAAATPTVTAAPRKSSFCSRLFRYLVFALAYLYATGLLQKLAHQANNRVWLYSLPATSTSEWMNVSAFAQAGVTSAVLKRMIHPRPVRGAKQLLIKVVKAGINPVDWKMRKLGPYWSTKPSPAISGLDFAGKVVDMDSGSEFKVGQRVFGMLPTVSFRWGTFAEYVVLDEEYVVSIPEGMSYTEAAATPLAALTALQALHQLGPVYENETILIHAGSGGVGTFAIQIAKKIMGLKVYTTSTSVELCKSLGADYVIDYKKEDFAKFKYDYVLDTMGAEYLIRGMPVTKKKYITILNSGWDEMFGTELAQAVLEGLSIVFFKARYFLSFGHYPNYDLNIVFTDGQNLRVLTDLIQRGVLKVVLDQEFVGLDDGARKAHDRSQSGKAKGKITLAIEQ